jgi:DNA-binding HxlR family transcriptional regulator
MLRRDYDTQTCSIARALEVVGERWSLLVVRDVLLGIRRFDDLVGHLGITRSVLTARLERLLAEGVLERRRYQDRPERFEYRLTDKGLELWPVLMHLMQWGDEHYAPPGGPPRLVTHRDCGGGPDDRLTCDRCGAALGPADVTARPNPAVPQPDLS